MFRVISVIKYHAPTHHISIRSFWILRSRSFRADALTLFVPSLLQQSLKQDVNSLRQA